MAARKKQPAKEAPPEASYPTPRRQTQLIGHGNALQQFADVMHKGRPAQSWLITGPEGIGKATFAFALARRLLAMQKLRDPLPEVIDSANPVHRRIAEASHTDLKVIEPQEGKAIPVDTIREVQQFVHLTAAESAWRVVIIDPADAMNTNAANALLKILEEPPKGCMIFLISHMPARLLPTIRSRCRVMNLQPLSREDFDAILALMDQPVAEEDKPLLYQLSGASPGVAIQLHEAEGVALYRQLLSILRPFPNLKTHAIMQFAEKAVSKQHPGRWSAMEKILHYLVHQLVTIRSGVGAMDQEDAAVLQTLAQSQPLDYWLELWENTGQHCRDVAVWNLDPKQTVLDILHRMEGSLAA